MSEQLPLAAASIFPVGTDPFAAARATYPEARLILLLDRRVDATVRGQILAVPPSSPWHALLPPEQIAELRDKTLTAEQVEVLRARDDTLLIHVEP